MPERAVLIPITTATTKKSGQKGKTDGLKSIM